MRASHTHRNSVKRDGVRVNHEIVARDVRLIDVNGKMIGIMSLAEALKISEEKNLDLVEIVHNTEPPVCKITDYSRYKYEIQKKAHEVRKKQKNTDIKEIKLRPNINGNDYEVKLKNIEKFLHEGDKVKVTMFFRGREIKYAQRGLDILQRVQKELETIAKTETHPQLDGRQITMILSSKER